MDSKVTIYKVVVPEGHRPHGKYVAFTTRKEAARYAERCNPVARVLTLHPTR